MSIHTNIKEIIKKHGRGIINLTIAVGVSFILSAGSLYFQQVNLESRCLNRILQMCIL